MPTYALFVWILIGGLIGWKGLSLIGKTSNLTQIVSLGLGIVGAMIGGYLAALLGWGLIMSLVLAILGGFGLTYAVNTLIGNNKGKA